MTINARLNVLAVLAISVVISACGSDIHTSNRVPKVVGLGQRKAEDVLATNHLRWRYGPRGDIQTRAMSERLGPDLHVGGEDDPILGQQPRAGTRITARTVVVLDDGCQHLPPGQVCID